VSNSHPRVGEETNMSTQEFETELFLPIPEEGDSGEVTCTVTFKPGWLKRGNRFGHPDSWTEDEGEWPEIHSVIRTDTGEDVLNTLTPSVLQNLTREITDREEADCGY
jgi:hypothetical protein